MNKGIFAPGINFLNKFKYPTKIGIISIVFILFITGFLFIISRDIDSRIEFIQKEKIGLEYIDGIKNLLQDMQQRRALTMAYFYKKSIIEGVKSEKSEMIDLNKKIDEDFDFINKTQQKNNYVFKMDKLWSQIINEWQNLNKNSLNLTPEESFKKHSIVINKIIYLISYISEVSNLVLDSELESFYLARSISRNLPELTEKTAQARSLGIGITARKKMIEDQKINLITKIVLLNDSLRRVNMNSPILFKKNKILKERLERFLDDINTSTNYFVNLTYSEIILAKNININTKIYYRAATSSINSSFRFYEESINTLENLLSERINKYKYEKNIVLFSALFLLFVLIYTFVCFAYALLKSLKALEQTALSVSQGNLNARAEIFSKNDEMGELSISFNEMIKNLKMLMERELILREVIISSLESQNTGEILRNIVNKTGKLFNADRCYLVKYDFINKEYLSINPNSVYISSLEFKNTAGRKVSSEEMEVFTVIAFKQKQVLVVNDVSKIIIPEATRALLKEFEIKSFMGAPLFYAGEPIGLLIVDSAKTIKEYTPEEQKLLETIANQSAIVINQAGLTEEIQEKIKRETLLREIINNILTSESFEKALSLICEEIGKIFDAERVKIRFFNKEENVFSEVVAEYRKNELIPSLLGSGKYSREISKYILKLLVEDKKLFIVDNIQNSQIPEEMKEFYRILSVKSIIESPIFYKDELIASVIIENLTTPKEWAQEKLDLLTPVCQQIAIGMNLFNLNEELKKTLIKENILKELTEKINLLDTYEKIDDYSLNALLEIFNVERAIHFHYIEDSIVITNEKTSNESIVSLKESWRFTKTNVEEILPETGMFITINDIESELKNGELKNYFRSQNINSFITYPLVKTILKEEHDEIIEITMLANSIKHDWTAHEKKLMKLLIDTISILSTKILQKAEIEEIKRTFIATLTHDLRSPILAEQKALEAIISKRITCEEEYLQDIYKTNEGLLKIVNNLLSVYHYESVTPLLNKTETNLKELIEESITSLKYLAADKESQIHFDIQEDLPCLNLDRAEISRVFSNLIGNAIKHTRRGTQITISALKKDASLQFSIQDNGEGIPKEHVNKIFQRYPVEKRKIGTGLGLYLSKQIVEAHGGKIWFETEEGVGTTFYFTLPV